MPLFCIIGFDAKDSKLKREEFLEPHLEALKKMNLAGRLFAAGPLMTSTDEGAQYCGSMLIIEFDSQEQAEAWFQQEPFNLAGVYKDVTIKPYLDALHLCQ